MIINLIKDGFKSYIESPIVFKYDSPEHFLKSFQKPKAYPDKSLVPLWNLAQYTEQPWDETLSPRQNFNRGLLRQKFLLLDFDSKAERFDIEKVQDHFSKYNYWFYTSYNNTHEIPKFRIILEMDKAYSKEDLYMIKSNYSEFFKRFFLLDDKTTFEINRWFCVPALNPEKPNNYSFKVNQGIPFPDDELEFYIRVCKRAVVLKKERQEKQMEKMLKERAKGTYDETKGKASAEAYAHKELSSMSDGSRHDTRLRISGFLHRTGHFTDDEIFEIMSPHCPTNDILEKTRKMVYNYRT